MSDRIVSLIRTVIPVWWGSLLAWLVGLGLPDGVAEVAADLGPLLVGLTIAGWYAVARWLESRLPRWLVRLLFGSSSTPSYAAPSAGSATPASPAPSAGSATPAAPDPAAEQARDGRGGDGGAA
ncbi:hypothetical protein FHR81_003418 [Actinoalloteichus hoggarensis]|uniref:Uncharacterized protein n=1 Tax=Actinoalloteichus hoggarensis TaxID=1470176 RepID=A0A221W8B1_9PSEU|nr:hypothetical protein [Actinoalloteichus hoggarensis]ASO21769.1 hypothetical protein AHOG_20760 [Actinoalloteichus hoggarensis]MBB5922366.1 hypothetical protein [Actinoalloteichus hoggarensis]